MNTATSTCDCKMGYVLNTTSNLCMGCQYSCHVCIKGYDTKCESCDSTTLRSLNSANKQCECKIGFYDDGIEPLCKACDYTCKSCFGSATNCTACPDGSQRSHDSGKGTCNCNQHFYDQMAVFVKSPTCAACSYHCSSCSDPTSCDTCNVTNHR